MLLKQMDGVDTRYSGVFQVLRKCLLDLNTEYIVSQQETKAIQTARFALGIINTLLKYGEILLYVNQLIKQDLIDSIGTHSSKYVTILASHNRAKEAKELSDNSIKLLEVMSYNPTKESQGSEESRELTKHIAEIIKEITTNIAQKCRGLFAEQSYNQEAIDKLQAAAIAFNINGMSIPGQIKLFEKILLVKELWQFENSKDNNSDNSRFIFHLHLEQILSHIDASEPEESFKHLVGFLTDDKNILEDLSNKSLIQLYDRLKNFEPQTDVLINLLHKIHNEAQFRYTYNRLSDSGYELLKRFQSYDAIIHQIDTAEFIIIETYLLRNSILVHEALVTMVKHIDNIKVVGAVKMPELTSVLSKIKTVLASGAGEAHNNISIMFSSIKFKLSSSIDPIVLKRYTDLDKFCTNSIKARYVRLCRYISTLLDEKKEDLSFVQEAVVYRLAQEYYIPNLSNSVSKLRAMAKDRSYIAKKLAEIDFLALFNPENLNHITSLNFKKQLSKAKIRDRDDYVLMVVSEIVKEATASQLESLYKPLVGIELTEMQTILRDAIRQQVKRRTTITKTIVSLFTGHNQEVTVLRNLKKELIAQ